MSSSVPLSLYLCAAAEDDYNEEGGITGNNSNNNNNWNEETLKSAAVWLPVIETAERSFS